MTERTDERGIRATVRRAGITYALVFLTGTLSLLVRPPLGMAFGIAAGVLYIGVTLLFYSIFRPAGRALSLLAALVSLAGCAIGPLGQFGVLPVRVHPLVFFGFYCLLIAYLILRSTFLPRFLAVLMAFAGLGWLTFLSPALAKQLSPYNMIPGILGEGVLTVWLLVKGVDVPQWLEQESGGRVTSSA